MLSAHYYKDLLFLRGLNGYAGDVFVELNDTAVVVAEMTCCFEAVHDFF